MEKNTTIEATLTELTALIRALLDGEVGEEACAFPAANAPIPSVPVPEERAIDMRRRTDTDGAYGTACGVLSRLLPESRGGYSSILRRMRRRTPGRCCMRC